eukprot:TRINITY_DN5223_c0_g1_i7.p1 TRINITY_DN5223_c0_g1~~TRINITY_DN5223_c0_g1_i7.p1  ORF type:complete len:103 (-),score=5.36 TRINITY_DN5223_c0_g1_i7:4-312(-)
MRKIILSRSAYRYTVETTVYVQKDAFGQGIGEALYRQLLDLLTAQKIHVAVGIITYPNEPSIKLHEKLGFTLGGHLKEMGLKFGKMIDIQMWHKILHQPNDQ